MIRAYLYRLWCRIIDFLAPRLLRLADRLDAATVEGAETMARKIINDRNRIR